MSPWFWVIAAVMTALAVAAVVLPMVRAHRGPPVTAEREANAAVYRRRLRELAAEREDGVLDEESYNQARDELERALVEDIAGDEPAGPAGAAAPAGHRGRWPVRTPPPGTNSCAATSSASRSGFRTAPATWRHGPGSPRPTP